MKNKIICIGRQFGSGGHQIAICTGEKLGIKVYDKDILELACRYGDIDVKTVRSADEKATNPYLFQTIHEGNHHVSQGLPTSEVLFELESHEIKRISAHESCIFVGRCADFVLKDEPVDCISVFVQAPFEQRVKRKAQQEQLSPVKARQLVIRTDKQRKKYYENYTGLIWGDPYHYDLIIDTGETGIDEAVDLIISRYMKEP